MSLLQSMGVGVNLSKNLLKSSQVCANLHKFETIYESLRDSEQIVCP